MRPIASLMDEPPQLVLELIDHTMVEWWEELVRQVFIPLDAEVEDFWAWNDDPKGRFSIRSTYRMIVRIKIGREAWLEEQEDPSNSESKMRGWNSL